MSSKILPVAPGMRLLVSHHCKPAARAAFAGVEYLEQLAGLSDEDLLRYPGIGLKFVSRLRKLLAGPVVERTVGDELIEVLKQYNIGKVRARQIVRRILREFNVIRIVSLIALASLIGCSSKVVKPISKEVVSERVTIYLKLDSAKRNEHQ